MILPITLTIAAAAALLHIWLSVRVSQVRRQHGIAFGDGGQPGLIARMRAHANFSENAPLVLILLGLAEMAGAPALLLWAAGILFVLARIAHAFGMDRAGTSPLRIGGVALTWLVLLALAGYAISVPYMIASGPGEMRLAPVRTGSLG